MPPLGENIFKTIQIHQSVRQRNNITGGILPHHLPIRSTSAKPLRASQPHAITGQLVAVVLEVKAKLACDYIKIFCITLTTAKVLKTIFNSWCPIFIQGLFLYLRISRSQLPVNGIQSGCHFVYIKYCDSPGSSCFDSLLCCAHIR